MVSNKTQRRTLCTQNAKNRCVLSNIETETSKNCEYYENTKRCQTKKNVSVSSKKKKEAPVKKQKEAPVKKQKETFVYMNVKLYHGNQYSGRVIKHKLEKCAVAFVKRYIINKSPSMLRKRNDAVEHSVNDLPNNDNEIHEFLLSNILELATHNARDQRSADSVIAYDLKRVLCIGDPFYNNIIKFNCKLINLYPNSRNPSYNAI